MNKKGQREKAEEGDKEATFNKKVIHVLKEMLRDLRELNGKKVNE